MALSTNIVRRGAVYQYRCRVPSDIVESFGKTEIKTSLGTKDPKEAKRRAAAKAVEVNALFDAHRQALVEANGEALVAGVPEPTSSVSPQGYYQRVSDEIVQRYDTVFQDVSQDVEGFLRGGYVSHPKDAWYDHLNEEGGWELLLSYCLRWELKQRLVDVKRARSIGDFTRHKELAGGDVKLAARLLDAEIDALEAALDQDGGADVPAEPQQPFSSPIGASAPIVKSDVPLLSVASEDWLAAKAKIWREKTVISRRVAIQQFIAFAGDRFVDQYAKKDVREYRAVLEALPANWTKLPELKGRDIKAAAKEAKKLGLESCKPKTVNNLLEMCGNCFNWLVKNSDDVVSNPFAGMQVAYKSDARRERDSFSDAELKALFSSSRYMSLDRNSALFWVPLIALFSGMRLQEICQLYVSDIVQSPDGIWYIDLNENQSDKSLKSPAAHRIIPVHHELEGAGLLLLVEQRRKKAPLGRMFPDCTKSKDGYYSSNFSKKFSRLLRELGLKREKLIVCPVNRERNNLKSWLFRLKSSQWTAR